jgi:hypothetical protein
VEHKYSIEHKENLKRTLNSLRLRDIVEYIKRQVFSGSWPLRSAKEMGDSPQEGGNNDKKKQ